MLTSSNANMLHAFATFTATISLVFLLLISGVIPNPLSSTSSSSDACASPTHSSSSSTPSKIYLVQLSPKPNVFQTYKSSLRRRNLACGWKDTISIGATFRCVIYEPNRCGPRLRAQNTRQIIATLKNIDEDVINVEEDQAIYTQEVKEHVLHPSNLLTRRRLGPAWPATMSSSHHQRRQQAWWRGFYNDEDEEEEEQHEHESIVSPTTIPEVLDQWWQQKYDDQYDTMDSSFIPVDVPNTSSTSHALNVDDDTKVGACQAHSPWHLIRISNKKPKIPVKGGQAGFEYDKSYSSISYVLDSKVAINDPEFQGRVQIGKDYTTDPEGSPLSYHGTHVASLIASTTYGSDKKALVINVPVIGQKGSASFAIILQGLAWATHDMANRNLKRAVVNISISGSFSNAVNDAVNAAYDAGAIVVVAAGNDNEDACKYSPSSAERVIVVGATQSSDAVSSFSNYGKCVDILAPGEVIPGVNSRAKGQAIYMSGTSMASPIVSGVLSSWLSTGRLPIEVAGNFTKLKDFLKAQSSQLVGTNKKNTTSSVMNNGWDGC